MSECWPVCVLLTALSDWKTRKLPYQLSLLKDTVEKVSETTLVVRISAVGMD